MSKRYALMGRARSKTTACKAAERNLHVGSNPTECSNEISSANNVYDGPPNLVLLAHTGLELAHDLENLLLKDANSNLFQGSSEGRALSI